MTRPRAVAPLCRLLLLALLVFPPLAHDALAETFGERVMAPGLLKDLAPEAPQLFQHSRLLPASEAEAAPPLGGYRRLERLEAEKVAVETTPEGKLALLQDGRPVAEFAKTSPHPVLLMFLENVMRAVAQETGGNPHYIRNRMRMTLGAAELKGEELKIAPFAGDPNQARFGDFAALEIEIRWQPGAPGHLTLLSATLPDQPERFSEIFRAE